MKTTREQWAGIKQLTARDNGHTWTPGNTARYVVGDGRHGLKLTRKEFYSATDETVFQTWAENLPDGFHGVGTWVDGDTVYIDPVFRTESELYAGIYATGAGELCIWDSKERKTIARESFRKLGGAGS